MRRTIVDCDGTIIDYDCDVVDCDCSLGAVIALYQILVAIPEVYDVTLPTEYYQWMRPFTPFSFDWDELLVPGACLPGGFSARVVMRGLAPLLLMVAAIPVR